MNSQTSPKSFRLILLTIAILLITSVTTSRSTVKAGGEEWRTVNAADLALKAPVVEPSADAEAIFWDIRIDDGGANDLVLNHYVRIKIFTERGRDQHSRMDIPFFGGVKIKDVAARTIKPDGSIVELAKEDIIEKTVVKVSGIKLKTKTFAFPGIEAGAIIEYKWKEVISDSSANNMRLQFQRDIPVQAVTYRIKPAKNSFFDVRAFNMPHFEFQKEKDGFRTTTVNKMPAFHEEPMMPPEDNVRAWAMIRYSGLFSAVLNYYLVAAGIHSGFQPFLKVDDVVKKKADEIIADAKTPEEKLERIFQFCRTNIKNTNDKNAGFTEDQIDKLKENKKPSDTLKRGVGPGIDINLLFAALANAAGFDSRVVLLPDRGQRLFNKDEIVPGALKPASIAVKVGAGWKFFDPGLPYVSHGMLRWQEEGVDGLVASESPVWVKTPMSSPDKSKEKLVANLRLDENGTLEGDITVELTGHLAFDRRVMNEDTSPTQREEDLKEAVKTRLGSAEVSNVVIESTPDPTKPFAYKYHVRVPEYAQRTGKRLFVQPGYFRKGVSAMFSASARKYPVYFHYPWSEEDEVTITLPKGYVLDNADRPQAINAGEVSKHLINMGVTKDQQTLVYKRSFFFGGKDTVLFPVGSYEQIKRLFDEVHKADNHMITLKQGSN